MAIWVCFCDDTTLPMFRVLKKGFRHCFAIVKEEGHWISYDPISSATELQLLPVASDFDVITWLNSQGIITVRARRLERPMKMAPLGFFTCVEAVKRLLCIHAMRIQTPWQLYQYLNKGD